MNVLTVTHNSGFFSCCCVRLESIVNFYNKNKKLPDKVDSTQQFARYKTDKNIQNLLIIKGQDTELIINKYNYVQARYCRNRVRPQRHGQRKITPR
jgi:hypothetical protein